jgi:hypothetical protein
MFKGNKRCSTTSFIGEEKSSAPCRKILWHVKEPRRVKIYTSSAKFTAILAVSPDSLLGVSAGICQKALVRKSGMIRTQLGTHNRPEMVAVHGTFVRYHPVTDRTLEPCVVNDSFSTADTTESRIRMDYGLE